MGLWGGSSGIANAVGTQFKWGCQLYCNIISRSDELRNRSDDIISHSDDIISRSDELISRPDIIISHSDDIFSRLTIY